MEICRTKDMGEACGLLAAGIELDEVEFMGGGSQAFFIFKGKKAVEASRKYWASELSVDARKMALAQRDIKDRLYSRSRSY